MRAPARSAKVDALSFAAADDMRLRHAALQKWQKK